MTIAIGVLCEGGAILLSDSMTVRQTSSGAEGVLTSEGKIGVIRELGLAYVHSGHSLGSSPVVKPVGNFEANAVALMGAYADLPRPVLASRFVGSGPGDEPDPKELRRIGTQELIVASIPSGCMGLLTPDSMSWSRSSGIFIAGAPTLWAREEGIGELPVPKTLQGALDLAGKIAARFIAHHYNGRTLADFAADGIIPPVAFPLNIVAVAGSAISRTSIRYEN